MGYHCQRTMNLIDPGSPGAAEEVEFELYDRKGYQAKWLEAKCDSTNVHDDVLRQVLEGIHKVGDQ